jgi:hypothetical protein
MSTSQPEKSTGTIIALVVWDLQKLRVRIVLAPEAIRELLREQEHPITTDKTVITFRERPVGGRKL